MKRTRKKKAIAILMVVLILAALVAIATPFALSMGLHERKARIFRDTVRARLAAEGAVAHAIAVLRRTEDYAEETRRWGPPWTTPDYDTEEEFRVDFEFADRGSSRARARLKKAGITFDDPRGAIWSVRVEDEQGKINILSAPPEVLGGLIASGTLSRDLTPGEGRLLLDDASDFFTDGDPKTVDGELKIGSERLSYRLVNGDSIEGLRRNLNNLDRVRTYRAGARVWAAEAEDIGEAARRGQLRTLHDLKRYLGPERFERIAPYVTTNSYRESSTGWLRREEVLGGLSSDSYTVTVRDAEGLGPGTRVRFVVETKPREAVYRVRRTRQSGERWRVTLEQQVGFGRLENETVYIEGEQRHPVNVNTAPLAVLRAVFAGVAPSKGRGLTREEAMELAEHVHAYVRGEVPGGKPLASAADVEAMLKSARENKVIGEGLSWRKLKALVENATVANSPRLGRSTLPFCSKSFGNFTIEAAALMNTRAGEESARYVMRELVSLPVSSRGRRTISSQKNFDEQMKRLIGRKVVTWPFVEPPTGESDLRRYTQGLDPRTGSDPYGSIRLATGKCADDGRVDHFEPGRRTFSGSVELTPDGADLKGGSVGTSGSSVFKLNDDQWRPVLLETWVKPDSASFTLFSALEDPTKPRNGLELKYENGEFVLTLADSCLDQGQDAWDGPARYTFLTDEITLGDWYHVALHVSGTGPHDATLCIDGRPVIDGVGADEVTYEPSARFGQFSPANKLDGCDLLVDDAKCFPKDGGAVLIDAEVVEYEKRAGNTLTGCRRASRYTRAADHAADSLVIPYGYSVEIGEKIVSGEAVVGDGGIDGNGSTRLLTKGLASGGYELLIDPDNFEVEEGDRLQSSGFLWLLGDAWKGSDRKRGYGRYVYYGKRNGNKVELVEWDVYPTLNLAAGYYYYARNNVTVQQISISAKGLEMFKFPQTDTSDSSGGATYLCMKMDDQDEVEWVRREYLDGRIGPGGTRYMMGWMPLDDPETVWAPRRDWKQWRGRLGTDPKDEGGDPKDNIPGYKQIPAGTKIYPVFRLKGPQCGDEGTRHHDVNGQETVTLCKSSDPLQAETRGISHASAHEYFTTGSKGARPWHHRTAYRVSLDRPVDNEYKAGEARLMRFPSGEMPRGTLNRLTVGPLRGSVDEIRCTSSRTKGTSSRNVYLFRRPAALALPDFDLNAPPIAPLPSDATSIGVTAEIVMAGDNTPVDTGSWRGRTVDAEANNNEIPDSGVVRIDDELIYYDSRGGADPIVLSWGKMQADKDKYCPWVKMVAKPCEDSCKRRLKVVTLDNCVRGILGTTAAKHLPGARVSFLEGLSLSRVRSPDVDKVPLTSAAGFPEEGYAVNRPAVGGGRSSFFSGEIFGWTRKRGDTLEGVQHLHGRFGTRESDIRDGDLVQLLPFRYWSRHVQGHDGSELAYFQTSISARAARWHSIEWAEDQFDNIPVDGMEIRLAVRFDGKPGWEERPSNRPGGLWEFRGAGRHAFSAGGGSALSADSIDVRVYFSYKSGAWAEGSNEWKRTLRLKNLTVTFGSPLVVRKVDLLDY